MANELGALIGSEVARGETDYQNVRTRALNIVAVAGGLVTLISGLLAIGVGSHTGLLTTAARWVLLLALLAFVGAAICALIVNIPSNVDSPKPKALKELVASDWDDEGWEKRVAETMAKYLVSLRSANDNRANWLIAAISLEIAGIAFTAIMALLVVQHLG